MRQWLSVLAVPLVAVLAGCGDSSQAQMRAAEQQARQQAEQAKATTDKFVTSAQKPADGEKSEPLKEETSAPEVGEAQDGVRKAQIAGHALVVPAGWISEKPSNNMRKGQFKIPKSGEDAEDAELAIYSFSGGLDANLKRWTGQMGGGDALKTQHTVKTASGDEATIAEFEGTYTAMTMQGVGAPQPGYKMLAAYIVSNGKEYQFKLTGLADTVDAAKPGFERMIESFK